MTGFRMPQASATIPLIRLLPVLAKAAWFRALHKPRTEVRSKIMKVSRYSGEVPCQYPDFRPTPGISDQLSDSGTTPVLRDQQPDFRPPPGFSWLIELQFPVRPTTSAGG